MHDRAAELPHPLTLVEGDLAVFPHGSAHRLADQPGRSTVPLHTVLPHRAPGSVETVEIGESGPCTVILCSGLHYNPLAADPLYRSLPPVLALPRDVLATQPLLAGILDQLAAEWDNAQPGASATTRICCWWMVTRPETQRRYGIPAPST